MLETSTLSLDGGELRYARHGSGPPLLCLHGYPETLQLYCRLARGLGDTVESIPVDWPGLGASDPLPGSTTPEERADHIVRILDGLGIDSAYLFGTDMGGPPALVAAAKYPDRVRGVIVSNSLVYADGRTSWEIELFRRIPLMNRLGLTYAPKIAFDRCLETFLPTGYALEDALVHEFWRYFGRRDVRDRLVEMCADYDATLSRLPAWYERVEAPVLVCWGSADHHFPPSQGRRLAEQVPDGTFSEIDGDQHWLLLHDPESIEQRVRRWIE